MRTGLGRMRTNKWVLLGELQHLQNSFSVSFSVCLRLFMFLTCVFAFFLHSPFAVWFLAFFGFLGWSRSTARSENFKCFEIPFNSENKHGWPGGRAKRSLRVTLGGAAWLVTSPM